MFILVQILQILQAQLLPIMFIKRCHVQIPMVVSLIAFTQPLALAQPLIAHRPVDAMLFAMQALHAAMRLSMPRNMNHHHSPLYANDGHAQICR